MEKSKWIDQEGWCDHCHRQNHFSATYQLLPFGEIISRLSNNHDGTTPFYLDQIEYFLPSESIFFNRSEQRAESKLRKFPMNTADYLYLGSLHCIALHYHSNEI